MKNILSLVKSKEDLYLSLCGNDFIYNEYIKNYRKVHPQDVIDRAISTKREQKIFSSFAKFFPNVIPAMFDYAEPYRKYQGDIKFNISKAIPLPIDTETCTFISPNIEKITILHGINRESKGTKIISEALNIIKSKYPDINVVISGNMSYSSYIDLINTSSIVVDQCYAFSYGMNSIISLAKGKVVLSNNEPECRNEFAIQDIPILNITPNIDQIVAVIEDLIQNKTKIYDISIKSRKFAEEFHDSVIVASQYIDVFKKSER